LPLEQLKIDQSFVRDILVNPSDAAIVRTIVGLGKKFGLSVIAEGVEQESQRSFLQTLDCHAYQGYLFGKPSATLSLPQRNSTAELHA
jgi:EAL domain-containing protein (putative c-di-GMP-specific phosphodiesterase class I)